MGILNSFKHFNPKAVDNKNSFGLRLRDTSPENPVPLSQIKSEEPVTQL